MSDGNANNNPGNGPTVSSPKYDASFIQRVRRSLTDAGHFVLRFYFSILLYVYFSLVKIFIRVLQPLQPLLEQMHTIPAKDATAEGIKNQIVRLLVTVLVYLSPLVTRAVGIATQPLAWARDQIVRYVEQGESDTSELKES